MLKLRFTCLARVGAFTCALAILLVLPSAAVRADAPNLLPSNSSFDDADGITGWTATEYSGQASAELSHDSSDVDADANSGSVLVEYVSVTSNMIIAGATQCVPIAPYALHTVRAWVYVPSDQAGGYAELNVNFYRDAACSDYLGIPHWLYSYGDRSASSSIPEESDRWVALDYVVKPSSNNEYHSMAVILAARPADPEGSFYAYYDEVSVEPERFTADFEANIVAVPDNTSGGVSPFSGSGPVTGSFTYYALPDPTPEDSTSTTVFDPEGVISGMATGIPFSGRGLTIKVDNDDAGWDRYSVTSDDLDPMGAGSVMTGVTVAFSDNTAAAIDDDEVVVDKPLANWSNSTEFTARGCAEAEPECAYFSEGFYAAGPVTALEVPEPGQAGLCAAALLSLMGLGWLRRR